MQLEDDLFRVFGLFPLVNSVKDDRYCLGLVFISSRMEHMSILEYSYFPRSLIVLPGDINNHTEEVSNITNDISFLKK